MPPIAESVLILYAILFIPATAFNVSNGSYSLHYALALHAILILPCWLAAKTIRHNQDWLRIFLVINWFFAGVLLHGLLTHLGVL